MTKNEFISYLGSLNKKPGEFTRDEIYDLGVKHKELPQADKSWAFLADAVGWLGTAESLRGFINDRMRRDGILTPRSTEETDQEKFFADLYIEKTKIRDTYNAYRKTLRDEARIEILRDEFKSNIDKATKLPFYTYQGSKDKVSNEAILMLSDLHIGVDCDNFYNKYNSEVAQLRLDKLAEDVIKYCQHNNVMRLNVVNLGDLIHGIIHVSAQIEQEFEVSKQIMVAGELVARFLNKIQIAAPEIYYRSCSDNHARPVANKDEHIEKDNFGRIIDWYLESRLANTNIKFCYDNIDYSLGKFTLLNGKKVMFAHGHLEGINQAFQSFIGASREFIDYGLLAHYHCQKQKDYQGFKVFVNGSIVGTEQYALSKRLFSEPQQTLIIFDDNNILNYSINLNIK